ncbi:MAG TPA: superoxide dismutase family protein [Propionibacteriaceae bacterium]|nr:superoxide dismutase family protein [Propionibacteriaceae bacterium]
MARYRKMAIAALAASALLLTPTAAYADHNHRGVSASSDDDMSWGYFSGKLTDFTTTSPDVFKDARASAVMIGMDGRSFFRLRVSGVHAKGTYGVHLHQGPCDADNPGPPDGAGPHYNVSWESIEGLSGPNIKKTEVWLDLDVDSEGDARSTATVSFIPEGKRSIVLHALGTDPVTGSAGARLACLPFNIKVYGN